MHCRTAQARSHLNPQPMKHLRLLLIAAILPFAASAQEPNSKPNPSATAPDASELTQLLRQFLEGASHNDLKMHERFWAEDLIYTSSSGHRRNKNDIRRDVAKEASSPEAKGEETRYTADDIRIQQYGTTAIVAFELVGTVTKEGKTETNHYLNTGTFLKRDGKWQAVAWQATKKAADDEPKK
jgi:hypothetical protein